MCMFCEKHKEFLLHTQALCDHARLLDAEDELLMVILDGDTDREMAFHLHFFNLHHDFIEAPDARDLYSYALHLKAMMQ